MTEYELVRENLISYFFTELSSATAPNYVQTLVKEHLASKYSDEWIEGFWNAQEGLFFQELVEEYNYRTKEKIPVLFEFIDADNRKARGIIGGPDYSSIENFQKALLNLSDYEFEQLSAKLLSIIGCGDCWCTSKTNDQGIDAFGCYDVFQLINIKDEIEHHKLWILVQAKHYVSERICTDEIRSFLGAAELAKYKAFAVKKMKYGELDIKLCSPLALFIVTSGEIKWTARLLANKAGITLITALDIYKIVSRHWDESRLIVGNDAEEILLKLKSEIAGVALAS